MRVGRRFGWVVVAALLLAAGCGELDDGSDGAAGAGGGGAGGGGGGGSGSGSTIGPIEWSACTHLGIRHACATIDVPLDWSDPDSQRIDVFVRRADRRTVASSGQLWLLQGGPGYEGADLLPLAPHFTELGFDVYVPDYRGTGRSTPLACVGETGRDVTPACKWEIMDRYEDGIEFFSTTGAALDIGRTIEAVRSPGEKVFVYGTSYGTFMLNRYLNLFPQQADGAIFDSICPAGGCNLRTDRRIDMVAKRVFDACGRDEACSGRLSADPWAKLAALQTKLDAGHCPAFTRSFPRQGLSLIIGALLMDKRFVPGALASVHRLDRCEPEDAAVVRQLLMQLAPGAGFTLSDAAPHSAFLFHHVVFSEFWRDLTPQDLLAELDELVVSPGYARSMVALHAAWDVPIHETPVELYEWADVAMPVLMLNGDLDVQTPVFDLDGMRQAFKAPGQIFVEVPNGGHGIIAEGTAPGGLGTCGFRMVADFLLDPGAAVDTSCLASLEILDMEGEGLGPVVFGTSDLWENDAPGVSAITAPPDPELVAAFERVKEHALRNGW